MATQGYKPLDFATQLFMSTNNMWGILKMLIEIFQKQPEGKFVMIRDPNKSMIRVYSVPQGTFEESDDDDDEEEVEGGGEAN